MRDRINGGKNIRGEVRFHAVGPLPIRWSVITNGVIPDAMELDGLVRKLQGDGLPEGWTPSTGWMKNEVLYEWGAIFGNLLMRKGLQYGIGGMYIEFENVASPGDPVAPPVLTRNAGEGVDYYNALSGSSDRDYLRVPLIASSIDSSDETNFPKGNRPSFFAQTTGVEGVHGKTFSDAVNSTVFGGALVAFVDETDHTQDIVLSRFYAEVASQQAKLPTGQVGFHWRLTLD